MKHQLSDFYTAFKDQLKLSRKVYMISYQDVEKITNKTWSLENWKQTNIFNQSSKYRSSPTEMF